MKLILTIIVLTWNVGNAQTIKTIGHLIDFTDSKIPAYCGYQIEYGILKVRIDSNVSDLKIGGTIYIFQSCPREAMEHEVGSYLNDNQYSINIGQQVSKADFAKAIRVFNKNYPNEKLNKIWYGNLYKLQ